MENYEIISFEEANSIRQKERLQIKYQIPENFAIVYETKDKRILLFPATGNKVVLFPNEQNMQKTIQDIGVPIPSNNIFVKNQNLIADWEKNMNLLLATLSTSIGINLNPKIEYEHINLISKAINMVIKGKSQEEIYENYYLTFGALVGKIITDNLENSEWKLFKHYDINPYYIPEIELNEKRLRLFKTILDEIGRGSIRLDNCLNRLSIKKNQ
jgi:hypothetical protein